MARCLSLFSNLHTVRIIVTWSSERDLNKTFESIFKEYSYPQIRNVFVMYLTKFFLGSCPEARRIGFIRNRASSLHRIVDNCPRLETLEDFTGFICKGDACKCTILHLFQISFKSLTISKCSSHHRKLP